MNAKSSVILFLLHCFACSDTAPNESPEERDIINLDALVAEVWAEHDTPSLAAATLDSDGLLGLGVAGIRKNGETTLVTAQDTFHLGSCGKAMTATVAAMLVDEGLLRWTMTLPELLPGLSESMHADFGGATLETLLGHTAGVVATIPSSIWAPLWSDTRPLPGQRRWFSEEVLSLEPLAAPGTSYSYSNAGYVVAASAMEEVTGQSFEDLLRTRVFEPLDMKTCGFGAPGSADDVLQPWGHDESGAPQYGDNPPAMSPAGTVHCSLSDWGKFAVEHLRGARGAGSLVSASSFERMHEEGFGNYGLGWIVVERDWAGGKALTHVGSNTLFSANIWVLPERNLVELAVTNQGGDAAFEATDAMVMALAERFIEP